MSALTREEAARDMWADAEQSVWVDVEPGDRHLTFNGDTCDTCDGIVGEHLAYNEATGIEQPTFTECARRYDNDGTPLPGYQCQECRTYRPGDDG